MLWTTNTPSGMPDEHKIIRSFWDEISRTPLAGRLAYWFSLHPKEDQKKYIGVAQLEHVVLTRAGSTALEQLRPLASRRKRTWSFF